MPFRVLAAFVGITGAVALIGTVFLLCRDTRSMPVGDIMMLPLMAWFLRLMFHAAIHGNTPKGSECWPLASSGVWNCYMLLLLAYWILKP